MKNTYVAAWLAVPATLLFLSCNNDAMLFRSLDDLEIRVLESSIVANLMPIVPPDPVHCELVLFVQNTSPTNAVSGISLPQGELRLSSAGQVLGTFFFTSTWDGRLNPMESDTVRLRKLTSPVPFVSTPCGEYVDLLLVARNTSGTWRSVMLDSLQFQCVH